MLLFSLSTTLYLCHHKSNITRKSHISECYYMPSVKMKMDTSVLLNSFFSSARVNSDWFQWNDLNFQALHMSAFQWRTRTDRSHFHSHKKSTHLIWLVLVYLTKPQVVISCLEPKYFLLFLTEFKFVSWLSCNCLSLWSKTPNGPFSPNLLIIIGYLLWG